MIKVLSTQLLCLSASDLLLLLC